jgi:hypothetical protein
MAINVGPIHTTNTVLEKWKLFRIVENFRWDWVIDMGKVNILIVELWR